MSLHHRDDTYRIVGCAMEVLNTLGPGLNEKPYENALIWTTDEHGSTRIP